MPEQVYRVRGGAARLFRSQDPELCLSGAAGTGKSLAALYRLHTLALQHPGMRLAILRQTHTSLTSSTLVTFEQEVAAPSLASGEMKWFGGSGRQAPGYRYGNGSVISVGGLDQPGRLLSTQYSMIMVDEADQISITAYETLLTRLRAPEGDFRQIILCCNPSAPSHWIKERADQGTLRMIVSLHRDNPRFMNRDGTPTVDGAEYMSRLDALTGVRRLRYRDGIWASAEGLVWDGWQDAVHLVDPFPVPADWRWVESVDFGYQHPMTWGRFAVDPDGRAFLVAEMSRRHRLVEDFAEDILTVRRTNGWARPEALVTDHAAGDRATLERYLGEATIKARKDVSPGIQAVAARLAVMGDGKPRFQVFRNSLIRNDPLAATDKMPRGFAAEVNGYVWSTTRGMDGIPREAPVKLHDDSADMVRYAVMHLDGAPPAKLGNPAAARPDVAAPDRDSRWSRPVGR